MLPPHLSKVIFDHVTATYPDEGCGFLIGREVARERVVEQVRAAPNTYEGSKRSRFIIHPRELLGVEDALEGTGRAILGFYHSHPDHPAAPSQFDQEHAWPGYSYLVVSVVEGQPGNVTSWVLSDDRSEFREEIFRRT